MMTWSDFLAVRLVLFDEQILRLAGDHRERIVDLVPGAGGELGESRQLFVSQTLGIRELLGPQFVT